MPGMSEERKKPGVATPRKRRSLGFWIGMSLLAVLAVAGLLFKAYEWLIILSFWWGAEH